MENEWQRNGEGIERERRLHFKEKMSLEEAQHHRTPWIRAWRKKKMNSTLLFSRFRKPEKFRKLLTKEEEEEIQEDVQRDSRVVKD